ncbi:MAG: hypothetical protein JRI87_09125 [Deltaproteobacteria bacterium]|nr:hypothetical protein [Deltaproteobacteria bacterium]
MTKAKMENHYRRKIPEKEKYIVQHEYQTHQKEINQLFQKTFSILKDLGADIPENVTYL